MKVLVTGAAGLIGNYLSRQLIWRGDDVVGIDTSIIAHPETNIMVRREHIQINIQEPIRHQLQNLKNPK